MFRKGHVPKIQLIKRVTSLTCTALSRLCLYEDIHLIKALSWMDVMKRRWCCHEEVEVGVDLLSGLR